MNESLERYSDNHNRRAHFVFFTFIIAAGRWTHAEHEMFVKGLELHSKQWKLIAELIKTRTVVQVRTHAQKYFQKLLKQAKIDGSVLDDAFADLFNDSSSDVSLLHHHLPYTYGIC